MKRILDVNNIEVLEPNYELGKLIEEKILVAHHEAISPVQEKGHWETVAEYPNGGRDVEWVIDVEGVEGKEAWDEWEEIYRYIPFTEEELAAIRELEKRPTQLDIIEAQVTYTAMMTGTLLEGQNKCLKKLKNGIFKSFGRKIW